MKINIQAMLNFGSKGAEKVKEITERIKENLAQARVSAAKIDKTLGRPDMNAGPGDATRYRGQRGVTGQRGASGRNFAGLAGMANDNQTGGFVAAYATIAANLFAVTAAFQALSKAAQTEQLAKGLDLVGARAGVSLPPVAKNLQTLTDNALSYADAMRVVAQATAAGFKQNEIERLTKVARGASVALGRDMSDSMDRLVRGTIKLEPELLDEIGIMTRLDEAVRMYAQANNRVVSSLTQTERRQAFLNAVLAEGERKFGDVSKQIEANPYDKLAASLRDLGTSFLNTLNGALRPVVKLLADMPGLALLPLIGVILSASSKVLPNLGTAFEKIGDKINIMTDRINESRTVVKALNSELAADTNKLRNGTQYDALFAGSPNLDRRDIADSFNIPKEAKEQVVKIREEMKRLRLEDKVGNAQRISDLRIIQEELRESLAINKQLSAEERIQKQLVRDQRIQRAMNSRLENVAVDLTRGNVFGALGTTFGGFFEDIGSAAKKTVSGSKDAGEAVRKLGASAITTGRAIGAIFTSMTLWIGAAIAAWTVLSAVIENWGTEAQKAYRKAIKELGELAERAKETRKQISMMFEVGSGQTGAALDAQRNSLAEIEARLRVINKLRAAADASKNGGGGSTRGVDVQVGTERDPVWVEKTLAQALRLQTGARKEIAELAVESLATVEITNKAEAEALRNKLMAVKTEEELTNLLLNQVDSVNKITARFSDLNESVGEFSKLLNQALPKSFETSFTKVNENVQQIFTNIDQLSKTDLKPLSKDAIAIGESFAKLSSSELGSFRELARASDSSFTGSEQEASVNRILFAKKDVENVEQRIYELQQKQIEQDSILIKLKIFLLDIEKQRLLAVLGILAAGDGGDALKAASESYEVQKRKLVIMQKEVETMKQLSASSETILKNNQEMAKLARSSSMAIALGGVESKLSQAEAAVSSRLDSLYSARQALELYNETLEAKKQEIQLNAQLAKQSIIEQRIRAQIDESKKLGKDPDSVEVLNSSNVTMFSKFLADIDNVAAAQTAALESQGRMLSNNVAVEKQMLAARNNGLLADQQSLEILNKKVAQEKEILSTKLSIRSLTSQEFEDESRRRTYRGGREFSPMQEDAASIAQSALAMDNLLEERDMLQKEFAAKLKVIEFEEKVAQLELDILKSNNPDQASLIDGLKADRASIASTLIENTRKSLSLSEEENMLKLQGISNSVKFLQEFTPALRALQDLKISLGKSKDNLTSITENPFMPSGTRGFLSSMSETAGGYGALKNSGKLAEAKKLATEMAQVDLVTQGLTNTFQALEDGIAGAFEGIITGSKSAKEAFADLAMGVLTSIAKMISQMIAFKIMSSVMGLPGIPMGAAGGTMPGGSNHSSPVGLANGGVMSRRDGLQGIVKQPTYLVGEGRYNEAVVPLPNGRAIPVQMHGAGSANNSVEVNVNLSSNGNVRTETQGEDLNNLGGAIAAAVQKELMAQKMPGGILNRYGAS